MSSRTLIPCASLSLSLPRPRARATDTGHLGLEEYAAIGLEE